MPRRAAALARSLGVDALGDVAGIVVLVVTEQVGEGDPIELVEALGRVRHQFVVGVGRACEPGPPGVPVAQGPVGLGLGLTQSGGPRTTRPPTCSMSALTTKTARGS